jgi:serine/threonine protein kinase
LIFKICDISKYPEYKDEIANEVKVYKALQELQGIYIPKLIFYGDKWGMYRILAMTDAGKPIHFPIDQGKKIKIIKALKSLHIKGVLHNDLRLENILEDSVGDIRFIDFALSQLHVHVHSRKLLIEEKELERLLGY